jgi:NitT/TauT family transport system substrate-binding protein
MKRFALAVVVALGVVAGVVGAPTRAQDLTPVKLQLKWVAQAQFAGYYAAEAKGYYEEQGLDVEILPGGPDIIPEQVVAGGAADIGINWLPSLLANREQGTDIVNIAQVYTRSGMREISFVDKGIKTSADLKGKKVGVWLGGNEFELFAALVKNGMDPQNASDVEIISQPFDMSLLLNGDVDAAAAMTYNELAQVLEAVNPATGKLYTLEELNVIDFNEEGTAMLQDGLFASSEWLAANEETAVKFLAASFKGWAFCRDNVDECTQIVLDAGTALGESHQKWQMNEVNKLIWPATDAGIGVMDEAAFKQTADISLAYKVISKEADSSAYRTDLATKALELLGSDFDGVGKDYEAITVELKEGGK